MNDKNSLAVLESRLVKLERRNRLLTTCLAAVLAIGVFTAAKTVSQPGSFSEARANRFVLIDYAGREVGVWTTSETGHPSLTMGAGKLDRIELYERDGHGQFHLRGSKEQELQAFTSTSGPSVNLYGRDLERTKRSLASIRSDTNGIIELKNSLGTRLYLSSSESPRTPAIGFSWRDKRPWLWTFTMYDASFNGVKLNLNKPDGTPILVLPEQFSSKSVFQPRQKRFPLFGPRR